MRDLRFALRTLRKSPGYAAIAIVTLGLAIGANTAIYSVVHGVLLRQLPYRDPARLVTIWESSPAFPDMSVCYLDLLDWRKSQRSFEDIAGARNETYNLIGAGAPEQLEGRQISASLLSVLGVRPVLGRGFLPEEDTGNGTHVALLSYGFWQRRFGSDPGIVGQSINMNGHPFTVVGVLPKSFYPVSHFGAVPAGDVYVPLALIDQAQRRRGNHPGLLGVGKLKPGVTIEQARADLEAIGRALGAEHKQNQGVLPALAVMHDDAVRDVRPMLLVLMGAVGFVLLIAAANVAHLMLARATTRRREMAIRTALGAGRGALIRQLLTEATLVALLGGLCGVLLALWGVDVLTRVNEQRLFLVGRIEVDRNVLLFSLAVSLATGILFGLVPAFGAARTRVHEALKEGDARTGASAGHRRVRSILVIGEVAMALVLLVGAGLSLRTFAELGKVDLGFRADHVLCAQVTAPAGHFKDAASLRAFLERTLANAKALPGVEQAALATGAPIAGSSETSFWVEGHGHADPVDVPFAVYFGASPELFDTLGLQVVAGRRFDDSDRGGAHDVVLIDERAAQRFFPEGAVGKHLASDAGKPGDEIIGVVRHMVHYGPGEPEPAPFQLYWPWRQVKDEHLEAVMRSFCILLRTRGNPETLIRPLAGAVAAADPELPIHDAKTMQRYVDESLLARRFAMTLLSLFALLAVVLASVGLYAVVAYSVSQRTHEIGVRMALGAQPGAVRQMVVRQALTMVAAGIGCGGAGALALTHFMRKLLYGVSASDPLTFAAVAVVLALTALAASWLPARRASRVDPMVALRGD
jgi:putative ABC transport system permease protein